MGRTSKARNSRMSKGAVGDKIVEKCAPREAESGADKGRMVEEGMLPCADLTCPCRVIRRQ
jgi:hypothetical protein